MEVHESPFVEALLAAPAGVALLARLEAEHRRDVGWFESPPGSDPDAVAAAVGSVGIMSFGRLVERAVDAAQALAGPWTSDAPQSLVGAYRHAEARRPIAEAVHERFGARLHRPGDPRCQEWWDTDPLRRSCPDRTLFRDFHQVYGSGEFTWAGLWTATGPPVAAHGALIAAWEMDEGPISRWRLPVRLGPRVWEIHRPDDWVRLVETYPKSAGRTHDGWELPGPNQHAADIAGLVSLPGQHGVRTKVSRHLLPDWQAVATDYDGVNLSWAGFLTTEGYVSDLGAGGVAMLRYWASERTHWLADVFDEPAPIGAPALSHSGIGALGVDVRVDSARRARDLVTLHRLLGR